ncbi:hypothetical protein FHS87_003805 [Roseomonas pecuniae]|uniref:Integrase catalytic domain-containing protein n=1 Tax=Muricoccus pecuniae TaxID=693023 RepID=A0A840YAK5_9PROT|nr:hypothetical protein [Roseomonas pecuniae]
MLNVVDEFTRECLAIRVGRQFKDANVTDVLSDLFILGDLPGNICSDNGPDFAATAVRGWIGGVGASTAIVEPGSPWGNGYFESVNGKLRDGLLNTEVFNTLTEAKVLIEGWSRHYNIVRPRLRPYRTHLERSPASQSVSASAQPLPMRHEHLARSTSWGLLVGAVRTYLTDPSSGNPILVHSSKKILIHRCRDIFDIILLKINILLVD